MNKFLLTSVEFEKNSWRKLSGLTIPIAERITVIAGHNGIGKSSILGFIANASGTVASKKSYFGNPYSAKFDELFKLTSKDVSARDPTKGYVRLNYLVNKKDNLIKRSNIGQTGERLRVVPRNVPHKTLLGVGADEKVPIPTIFVSASRTWPLGEGEVASKKSPSIDPDDAELIFKIHDRLIPGEATSPETTELEAEVGEGVKKRSQHPQYNYDVSAISIGQGAISHIATAIASFQKLKRTQGREYKGGLLLIDEIEAGLHPRAQIELVKVLRKYAKDFNIQIIVTTHSLTFLEAIFQKKGDKDNTIEKVVYLMDTKNPVVKEFDLKQIRDEMTLSASKFAKSSKPTLMVLTEDKEGLYVLNKIKTFFNIKNDFSHTQIKNAPMKLGCNQMIGILNNQAARWLTSQSIFIFDGDVTTDLSSYPNALKLPTAAGKKNSPEMEIFDFLERAHKTPEGAIANLLRTHDVSWDRVNDLVTSFKSKTPGKQEKSRDIAKKWFNHIPPKTKAAIVNCWIENYESEIKSFADDFSEVIKKSKGVYKS